MKENTSFEKNFIILLVAATFFMEFLDGSILNTAIPSIAKDFSQNPLILKFSIASYLLSLAVFIPISGWCVDKYGIKKVYIISVMLFGFASFCCAYSSSVAQLACSRFLQGAGGAFMIPAARILILRLFNTKDYIRVLGYVFSFALLGLAMGPLLGGIISTYFSWKWIFYINIPVCAMISYGVCRIPENHHHKEPSPFDFLGFFITGFSLCSLSYGVEMIGHSELLPTPYLILSFLLGLGLFIALIFHCKKKRNPVLDFSLLSIKTFRIGSFSSMIEYFLGASTSFLIPLMFQEQYQMSPVASGLLTLPIAIGLVSLRPFVSLLIMHFGFKNVIFYASIVRSCGILSFSIWAYYFSFIGIIICGFIMGLSSVCVAAANGTLNYVDIPKKNSSRATALDMTFRQFSGSIGIGIASLCLGIGSWLFQAPLQGALAEKAFFFTFLIIGGFSLLNILLTLDLLHSDGEHAIAKPATNKPIQESKST